MAEDKKSFVLYCDYREHLQLLSDSERGQLFTAILDYANDIEVGDLPPMVKMAFSFIKSQMDKDAEKYAQTVKARSEAGKKSAAAKQQTAANGNKAKQTATEPKPESKAQSHSTNANKQQQPSTNINKSQQNQQTATNGNKIQQIQQSSTNSTDNDNVNDNVNVDVDIIYSPPTPQGGRGGGNDVYSERFKDFWAAYPKKIGKDAALKAFMKRKPSAELLSKMIAAIEWQSQTDQWKKDGGQYIPNPATWLNQGRWEDEPLTPTVSQNANINRNPNASPNISQNPFINGLFNGGDS